LTSAAYGPEAAMTLLIPLGSMGCSTTAADLLGDPDAADDCVLQLPADDCGVSERRRVVHGGEREPGRPWPGLLAAAALMIDYILTAAVGISAGVTALVTLQEFGPRLHRIPMLMCLLILAVLAIVNMRGVKDTGAAFMLPTFLFVGTLLATIGVGCTKAVLRAGIRCRCGSAAAGAAGDSTYAGNCGC
jgi:amino acid transporter